jgi:hypothetical protein
MAFYLHQVQWDYNLPDSLGRYLRIMSTECYPQMEILRQVTNLTISLDILSVKVFMDIIYID